MSTPRENSSATSHACEPTDPLGVRSHEAVPVYGDMRSWAAWALSAKALTGGRCGLPARSMSTLSLSEVKARLSEIADEVDRTHERVHVTRIGREYVVLLSAEDLESLEATIELLRDEAGMGRVRDAEAAVAAGDLTTAEDIGQLMAQRRAREHRER